MKRIIDFTEKFHNNEVCKKYLYNNLFEKGLHCLLCKGNNVWEYKTRKYIFKCKDCNKQFSLTKNSIFENSSLPLKKWFLCIYLITNSSKGISSLQLANYLSVLQPTAWFMAHRVRNFYKLNKKNRGDVEIDETYIEGKEKNKHYSKKIKGSQDGLNKQIIVGSIQRDVYGNKKQVLATHLQNTKTKTLKTFIKNNIDNQANIISDEYNGYNGLSLYKVNHSAKEYIKDNVIHTNNIENFWSIFKRGYVGVYHYMSKKQRYINEYAFRYNNKECLLNLVLNNIKRITYKDLING